LWPKYKLEELEDRLFQQRRTLIGDSIHIRVKMQGPKCDA
jgi:hypothetical protein